MINIKSSDSNLLKIDIKSHRNIDTYYIGYEAIKKINDYENIYSVNSLYLIVDTADGHNEEKNGKKYLTFPSSYEKKEVLKKCAQLWNEIKYLIKRINGGREGEYKKIFYENSIHFKW